MKFLTMLFLILISGNQAEPDIQQVRMLYEEAPTKESSAEKLISLLDEQEGKPLWFGYKGVATMIMAKHVFSPFKKMSLFKEGKEMLQQAIEKDRDNVELRFLRFSAQSQAPGFLGYKENVDEDRKFLITELPKLEDHDLKKKIRSFLLQSGELEDAEKERLKNE